MCNAPDLASSELIYFSKHIWNYLSCACHCMRAFSFNTTVTTAGRLPLAHCVYFKAPTVSGLQMFSLNQMMSSISQSATLLSFLFSGNLNVSH